MSRWLLVAALRLLPLPGAAGTAAEPRAAVGPYDSSALAEECMKKLGGESEGSFDSSKLLVLKDVHSVVGHQASGALANQSAGARGCLAPAAALSETRVTGQMGVRASNSEAFVRAAAVRRCFRALIAEATRALPAWVDVTLASDTRRRMGAERRLGSNVLVNYVITIPSGTVTGSENGDAGISTAPALTATEATARVQGKLDLAEGPGAYTATVTEISEPTVVTYAAGA